MGSNNQIHRRKGAIIVKTYRVKLLLFILTVLTIIFFINIKLFQSGHKNKIIKIHTIQDAEDIFAQADENTLIVFDIDSTLTTPSDPALRRHAIKKHLPTYTQLTSSLTPYQKQIFDHLLAMKSPSQLLEPGFLDVILRLHKKGVNMIACTASKMGAVGDIEPQFQVWRFNELKRLGIDFSQIFPGQVLFPDLADYNNGSTGMEKGIICSGHKLEKGVVFLRALAFLACKPTKIIFIDDKLNNVDSFVSIVQKALPNVKVIGVNYLAVLELPKPIIPLDEFKQKMEDIAFHARRVEG